MSKVQDENIVSLIKEICKGVFDSQKPSTYYYGTVISINPLKVRLSTNLILTENFLKIPKSLTDYTININMDWFSDSCDIDHTHNVNFDDRYTSGGNTENKLIVSENMNSNNSHSHKISGIKQIIVYNALKVGDKVYLGMCQGRSRFYNFR